MKRTRFVSTIASALALGLIGGAGAPASISQQAAVSQQLNGDKMPAAPAPVGISAVQFIREMDGGFSRVAYGKPHIWRGIQKRGNRKGRSRFNYNR